MFRKPFQAPRFANTPAVRDENEPPAKRPRLANDESPTAEGYYNVLWRKFTTKKHKTWDGDGVLKVKDGYAFLQDVSGRDMGKTMCAKLPEPGSMLSVGGKEVEVESVMSKEDFYAGRPFLGTANKPTVKESDEQMQITINFNSKPLEQHTPVGIGRDKVIPRGKNVAPSFRAPEIKRPVSGSSTTSRPTSQQGQARQQTEIKTEARDMPRTKTSMLTSAFKTPVLDKSLTSTDVDKPKCRYDPQAPGAVVMKRPMSVPKGRQVIDVVVDPFLTACLREHQKEGVKFMYECVMGMRADNGEGAVLADEMGLGKTLQVIALLWTLLKQNPIHPDPPILKKALIVCPVTLIKNWKREFRKWLGNERVHVFTLDEKTRLTDFTKGKIYNIMIIGYEKLRTVQKELAACKDIGIVIADEGHRLKTAKNKSAEAIKSLSTERRIILSGTPLQNDLSEFYTMIDFVNPGLLGRPNTFKKEFETPILRSRQPGASDEDIEKGDARSQELARLTSVFILRRTAEILSQYLPPKSEYVVFCEPTKLQTNIYRDVLASPVFGTVLGSSDASLQLINILKKLCNSPSLLQAKDSVDDNGNSTVSTMMSHIKIPKLPGSAGKFQVLDQLLFKIHAAKEKVVIVSHYTSTLDILGNLINGLGHKYLRLDGTTPTGKRQDLVDTFNRSPFNVNFAFLLSAKSGGAGLNLIGASRLILYDTDWNPATDLQAMARIHRDGQQKHCKIYRLLTRGALDEKIYQRQVSKMSLADSVVDNKVSASTFTREELRQLFTLDVTSICQTHDLLRCQCGGRGEHRDAPVSDALVDLTSGVSTAGKLEDTDDIIVDVADVTLEALGEDIDNGVVVEADEKQNDTEVTEDKESDDELPPIGTLIKASQLDWEAQERAIQDGTAKYLHNPRSKPTRANTNDKGKGKMMALMQYDHIDADLFKQRRMTGAEDGAESHKTLSELDQEAIIEDDVLRSCMSDQDSRIRFVFARTS